MKNRYILDDITDLTNVMALFEPNVRSAQRLGIMYCPTCSEEAIVHLTAIHEKGTVLKSLTSQVDKGAVIAKALTQDASKIAVDMNVGKKKPALFSYRCNGCNTNFAVLLHTGTNGCAELAIFPEVNGGLSSPHAPEEVTFYLNEAYKCRCAGAHAAALAMFRAALDQLLVDQKLPGKRLPNRMKALNDLIAAGNAPAWAQDLDTTTLSVTKELGDGFMHAGDAAKQEQLTPTDSLLVQETFKRLITDVYERSAKRSEIEKALKSSLDALKPPKP